MIPRAGLFLIIAFLQGNHPRIIVWVGQNQRCFREVKLLPNDEQNLVTIAWGATKTRDRKGLAGIGWSRVLAFGTIGSRVPGFDLIVITGLICFSPLAMNDRERMCIGLAGLIDWLQSIYQNFIFCRFSIVKLYFIKMK